MHLPVQHISLRQLEDTYSLGFTCDYTMYAKLDGFMQFTGQHELQLVRCTIGYKIRSRINLCQTRFATFYRGK